MLNEWSDRSPDPDSRLGFGDIVTGAIVLAGMIAFVIGTFMALIDHFS